MRMRIQTLKDVYCGTNVVFVAVDNGAQRNCGEKKKRNDKQTGNEMKLKIAINQKIISYTEKWTILFPLFFFFSHALSQFFLFSKKCFFFVMGYLFYCCLCIKRVRVGVIVKDEKTNQIQTYI